MEQVSEEQTVVIQELVSTEEETEDEEFNDAENRISQANCT